MKFSVLASGSKGNSTYIKTINHNILVDIGTSSLYIEKKLEELSVNPKDIDMIFITHDHIDHINGLKVFYKKYKPKVYMSEKLFTKLSDLIDKYENIEECIQIDSLNVDAIKTSHDATDSQGYIFTEDNKSIVYITDTGYINRKWHNKLKDKNVYIFESNHDIDMLMNGKYPYHLKQRILGDKGHLSNLDSSKYLSNFIGSATKFVVLAHLSEENNTPLLAETEFKKKITNENIKLFIATQNERTDLIEI